MRWLPLCALLSLCVHPDIYCPGAIAGETLEEKAWDAWEECAPMIRMRIRT